MSQDYNRDSTDAAISRIEAKLDITLERLNKHGMSIDSLWKAVGKLDVRVAVVAITTSGLVLVLERIFFK